MVGTSTASTSSIVHTIRHREGRAPSIVQAAGEARQNLNTFSFAFLRELSDTLVAKGVLTPEESEQLSERARERAKEVRHSITQVRDAEAMEFE